MKPLRDTQEVRSGEKRPIWSGVLVDKPATLVTGVATTPDASTVFAATSNGVHVSRDDADHFSAWDIGDGPRAVVAVAVSPSYARDRLVYALALGGAIWRRRDA